MNKTLVLALAAAALAACGGDDPEPRVCEYVASRIQAAGCPNNAFSEDLAECEGTLVDLGACRDAGEAWMVCIANGPITCVGGWAETSAECPGETAALFECLDRPAKPAPL